MKNLLILIAIIIICGISFTAKADKTFKFTYDANGNRTVLTFVSTCRTKNPDDTAKTKIDTTVVIDSLDNIIKEIKQVNAPSVYPTLIRDYFTVSFPTDINNGNLQIVDMNGNILFTETGINTSNIIVKTCDLPNGMYNIVVYYSEKKPFVQKIVKQ